MLTPLALGDFSPFPEARFPGRGRVLHPWAHVSAVGQWRPWGPEVCMCLGQTTPQPKGAGSDLQGPPGQSHRCSNDTVTQCGCSLGHGSIPPAGTLCAAAPSKPMCSSPAMGPLLCPRGQPSLWPLFQKTGVRSLAWRGDTRSRTPVLWGGKETAGSRACTQAGGNSYQMLGSR